MLQNRYNMKYNKMAAEWNKTSLSMEEIKCKLFS